MNRFTGHDWLAAMIRIVHSTIVGLSLLLLAASAFARTETNHASLAAVSAWRVCLSVVVDQSGYVLGYQSTGGSAPWALTVTTYSVDPIIDQLETVSTAQIADDIPGAWAYRAMGVGVYWMPDPTLQLNNLQFTCRHWVACSIAGMIVVGSVFRWRRQGQHSRSETV